MTVPRVAVLRNEVDAAEEYHCDALAACFPTAVEFDYAGGERPDLEALDAVVLTGSTAGVYEADEYPWMRDQQELVAELLERRIPTLGVCFGHQLVNAALGGTVGAGDTTARLVEADLADDPIFDGVSPVVPALHGDHVTEPGDELVVIGSSDHSEVFATRHPDAPLWTTQFHPEFHAAHRLHLERENGWSDGDHSFVDVNASLVYENFTRQAGRETDAT